MKYFFPFFEKANKSYNKLKVENKMNPQSNVSLAPALATVAGANTNDFNLTQWYHSYGSIYLKYVPNELNKEELTYIFSEIGKVSRVDIVNSAPNKNTGACYRMAFIHFEFWYNTEHSGKIRSNLVGNFPNPFQYWSCRVAEFAINSLTLMINTRPVPKTIYNVDQLSDMYHRLREEYTDTVTQLRQEIDELKSMVRQMASLNQQQQQQYQEEPVAAAADESHINMQEEEQMNFERIRQRDPLIYNDDNMPPIRIDTFREY